jgi:predicted NAD-dependent protein-ADP-ribosyltransferase YbiA (DUF1768 family)
LIDRFACARLQSSAIGEETREVQGEEDYFFFLLFSRARKRKDVSKKKKIVDAKNTPENSSFLGRGRSKKAREQKTTQRVSPRTKTR